MIALIDAINEVRVDNGLGLLKQEPRLMEMASHWSIQMNEVYHSMSHDHFQERLYNALGGSFAGGECVAKGQQDVEQVVEAWMEDEGHRVILLGDFDSVGCGYEGGYWTADLAKLEL
jgi:uncharacterized protein YkwD